MTRILYWGAATHLLAVVVHLFVVIFVPGVYGETGANTYTLNDRQAGVQKLQMMIVTEEENFDDKARPENTIIVRVPTASGLVLFRAFVSDRSQAELVESHLNASKCGLLPVKSAQG